MLRRFKRYLEKRNMILSAKKSKILVFEDGRGRKKKREWRWGEENIEEVKKIKYLGYILQKNGGTEADNRKVQESDNSDEEDMEYRRKVV